MNQLVSRTSVTVSPLKHPKQPRIPSCPQTSITRTPARIQHDRPRLARGSFILDHKQVSRDQSFLNRNKTSPVLICFTSTPAAANRKLWRWKKSKRSESRAPPSGRVFCRWRRVEACRTWKCGASAQLVMYRDKLYALTNTSPEKSGSAAPTLNFIRGESALAASKCLKIFTSQKHQPLVWTLTLSTPQDVAKISILWCYSRK